MSSEFVKTLRAAKHSTMTFINNEFGKWFIMISNETQNIKFCVSCANEPTVKAVVQGLSAITWKLTRRLYDFSTLWQVCTISLPTVACKGSKGKVGAKLPKGGKLFILISNRTQNFTFCVLCANEPTVKAVYFFRGRTSSISPYSLASCADI